MKEYNNIGLPAMKRLFFLLLLSLQTHCALEPKDITQTSSWEDSPLFDTQFLLEYDGVTNHLKEHGFQEGFFTTSDDHELNYLYLERPDAEFTVILAAGWLPGRKEGIATFHALLPESCNILFFDARGHGKSDGHLLRRTWIYGRHEYKDVIGALDFVRAKTNKPIIMYGVCAGAFHAAHAFIYLQKQNKLKNYNIKGFIFDSGWASLLTVSWTAPVAKANEAIARFWAKFYGKKWKEVLNTIPYRVSSYIITKLLVVVHTVGFLAPFAVQEKETNLFDKIEHLSMPMLYIHSLDDEYVPIAHAQFLAKKSQNAQSWWIDKPSKHACHCLKYKHEYREILHNFLAKCLAKDHFLDGLKRTIFISK